MIFMNFKITSLHLFKNGEWALGNVDGLPIFKNSFDAVKTLQQTQEYYQIYDEYKDYRFDSFMFIGRYIEKE